MERVETLVVGAGQAGLATSFFLTHHEREHVVLERGRIGNTWRTERWDGFVLNTPNLATLLPGAEYDGDDPNGFAPLAEVVEYVEGYARSFGAPVREGVEITALRRFGSRYVAETPGGALEAENVVVATGAFQQPRPRVPGVASAPVELQLTTSEYRAPAQLPHGAVLVVGGGQSGCQISDELLDAGRRVILSVGRCPWFPRRYRGRDIVDWALELGMMDETVDSLPSPAARMSCNPPVSGNDGGHDCHPRWLAGRGATVVGRLEGVDGPVARFGSGVEETLAGGDAFVDELTARIDGYIASEGIDAPLPDERERGPANVADTPELDLSENGISTILWATGFRPDYAWIDLDVTDEHGWPVQDWGVSPHDGLYFVGVNWLHTRKSALLCGVGEDAGHVVSHLVGRGRT